VYASSFFRKRSWRNGMKGKSQGRTRQTCRLPPEVDMAICRQAERGGVAPMFSLFLCCDGKLLLFETTIPPLAAVFLLYSSGKPRVKLKL
jgi:hypothetical protein